MTIYDLESLKQTDEVHREAGVSFDQKWAELLEAQRAEAEAGRERINQYQAAFAGGLIIEKIVSPYKVEYKAGWKEVWIRGTFETENESVRLTLDNAHADSLRGAFAANVHVVVWPPDLCRQIPRGPEPQSQLGLKIGFDVAGRHDNTGVDDKVHRSDEEATTRYTGELQAIEWRLPTEEEVQKYGALAVAVA